MVKHLDISDKERAEASRRIANFFTFTEDVLADPGVLDGMPDTSQIEAIPKAEREPGRRYDVETRRMVATVTPVRSEASVRRS